MNRPCHAQGIKVELGRDTKEPFKNRAIKHSVVTKQRTVAPVKGQ